MAMCPHRLEVRDRWHSTTFQCELPEGHPDGLHRSLLLTAGYEKAVAVELLADPEPGEGLIRRRETTDVIVVWK